MSADAGSAPSAAGARASALAVRRATWRDYEEVRILKNGIHAMHMEARPDYFRQVAEALPKEIFALWLGAAERAAMAGGGPDRSGEKTRHSLYVAERRGDGSAAGEASVVGYLLMTDASFSGDPVYQDRRRWVLEELCVGESLRGRGIGSRLFSFAEDEGRRLGYVSLELSVWAWNEAAADFYRVRGMSPRTARLEKAL